MNRGMPTGLSGQGFVWSWFLGPDLRPLRRPQPGEQHPQAIPHRLRTRPHGHAADHLVGRRHFMSPDQLTGRLREDPPGRHVLNGRRLGAAGRDGPADQLQDVEQDRAQRRLEHGRRRVAADQPLQVEHLGDLLEHALDLPPREGHRRQVRDRDLPAVQLARLVAGGPEPLGHPLDLLPIDHHDRQAVQTRGAYGGPGGRREQRPQTLGKGREEGLG